MPQIERWKVAKASAYKWVQNTDRLYVAARFLSWKGFPFEFALLGAHAMELYLKAFLIHRTGRYPVSHDLKKIYEACMELDDFFKDEYLSRQFLPIKPPLPYIQATWTRYSDILRYPESLPEKPREGGVLVATGYRGTYETLDCIAYFVKRSVPRAEQERDIIDNLINGDGDIWAVNSPDEWPEIRKLFLRGNQYFSPLTKG